MRKGKTYIAIFLVVALLLIGIGYAAITKELHVTGAASAVVEESNFVVKFTGTPEVTKTLESSTATAEVSGDLAATINVEGLKKTGDSVTVKYEIQNASTELSADLAASVVSGDSQYFKVTPSFEDSKDSIAKSETTKLVVKVELIKTPIEAQSTTIDVKVDATAVEP